jgi:acyl-homoserine lactone acylase PvdQ
VLTYSQATEPSSPWYLDQLDAWSVGAWYPLPFAEPDIAAGTLDQIDL